MQYVYDEKKSTRASVLATRIFQYCKWYIAMVVSFAFYQRTSVVEVALAILYTVCSL